MTRRLKQEIDLETGIVVEESHFENGKTHRDPTVGPAHIMRDARNGAVVCERYMWLGKVHRVGGPAKIVRNPVTGVVWEEGYWHHGLLHREPTEGPAWTLRDKATGTIATRESYSLFGTLYRNPAEGPKDIFRSGIGGQVLSEYFSDPDEPRPARPLPRRRQKAPKSPSVR